MSSVRLGRANKDSTLLGPERTTEILLVADAPRVGWLGFQSRHNLVFHTGHCGGAGGGCGVVGWSLVENCTVDASILFSVVKLSRANGGCLGTRSR